MKYLKKYEKFYNEDFKEIKENFGKRESEEDEKAGDQGFDKREDKSQRSDVPAEVETPTMSDSEGGSGHGTKVDKNIPKEVETPTMESNDESVEGSEGESKEDCDCDEEDCEKCGEDEKVDEGAFQKFFTGHDSKEDKGEAMKSFHKTLDEAEEVVEKSPEKYVFNRKALEKQAKENNYRGGIKIRRGGRDKSKAYLVYNPGATGFQKVATGSGSMTVGT